MTGFPVTGPAGEGGGELGKQGERDEQLAKPGLVSGAVQCSAVFLHDYCWNRAHAWTRALTR